MGSTGPDLTVWQFWWGFNKEPYLNLKSHIHSGSTLTGSDDFFLGQGEENQGKDSLKPSEETIRQKIVPALLKALENETNNDIVTACLVALAKIGDAKSEDGVSKFEQVIKTRLNDPVQEIRETAAVALGILANPASRELLTNLLMDTSEARTEFKEEAGINFRTRAFAAYGLGLIGYRTGDMEVREKIVKTLWDVCQSPRMSTRDIKVAAVISMGLVPLESAPMAEGEEAYKPNETAPTSREQQITYLITFFKDENNDNRGFTVRAHAPRSIALLLEGAPDELKNRAATAMLDHVGGRAKGEKEIRQSCALALGQIGDLDNDDIDKEIRKALTDSESDADQQTKNYGMIALGQVGGRPGTGDDPTAGLKDVRNYLGKNLVRGRSRLKPWVALAIGIMERSLLDEGSVAQSSDMLTALRSGLRDEKAGQDVGAYALALGIARDIESQSILLEKLDSFSEDTPRGDISVALGLMNSVQAIEPIQEIVKKSKYRPDLLKNAAIALGLLGDKNVVTDLIMMLREEAKTLTTQAAVASALGFIGDSRSIDPLVEMLQDTQLTDRARAFAAVALGIVADKEPLPWNTKISVDLNYLASTVTLTSQSVGTGILDIL
jgi:HEAT repeat protein